MDHIDGLLVYSFVESIQTHRLEKNQQPTQIKDDILQYYCSSFPNLPDNYDVSTLMNSIQESSSQDNLSVTSDSLILFPSSMNHDDLENSAIELERAAFDTSVDPYLHELLPQTTGDDDLEKE
jgi:hypothetical protein